MSIRVLSYPPAHDYVDRLHPHVAELVHRDEDWPALPRFYDAAWLGSRAGDWDLAHFHFTWEQYAVERLVAVLDVHARAGTPILWTAHDLRNPHTRDGDVDADYLRALATSADEVVTLTPGAAEEIRRRFARSATVVPHGPVLDPEEAGRWRRRASSPEDELRLVLHLRAVRTNVDWRTPIRVVGELAADGAPVHLDVFVLEDAAQRAAVERAADVPGVEVRAHPRLALDELCVRLVEADAIVLPYLWGTHSGMVELAADLGLAVIVGDVGYISEQAPALPVPITDDRIDPDGLRTAIQELVAGRRPPALPVEDRERALDLFRDGHAALYERSAGSA